jgi:hypothetical protein
VRALQRRGAGAPGTVSEAEPDSETDDAPAKSGWSRRTFLARGSMTVMAAGLVSALPTLPLLAGEASSEAPEVDGAAASAAAASADGSALAEPLIVQVRNLQTGEMSLYLGQQEITYHDTALAARLMQAAR